MVLKRHPGHARSKVEALCDRLPVPTGIRKAVVEAAGQHDLGKDRLWWQRAVGRIDRPAVAKSGRPLFDHKTKRRYRHELGWVADLECVTAIQPFCRQTWGQNTP